MSDIHALSGAYAIDALEPAERLLFEQHLATCADCRAEVASLQEAAAMLPETTEVPPPPALRDRVLSDISTVRPLPPEVDRPDGSAGDAATPLAPRRRRFRTALTVAAAVAALIGGGVVVATQPWSDDQGSQTQLSAADRVLNDPEAEHVHQEFPGGAAATLVRSKAEGKAVLVTTKMPPAPDGKVYELWFQDASGSMVPAGLMPPKSDQTVLLSGDATDASAVGITVEPAGGSDEPTSDPIALFELGAA
ncbi:anti-sigma factor [Nocardioides guangzhouensis]|uniref:Regulator of SigK n=1 Tax=Nocardioides guangzhouensis TaxID=2497878 RepID=A0A4Q4ZH74_9ACTN|nr:anti-sigma factor [Nocardioides guangzhouensis]RYP87188.1 anti-sigma factor [Nocardioides guangzhouensis]